MVDTRSTTNSGMEIEHLEIGRLVDSNGAEERVDEIVLRNKNGVQITCLSYGATLRSVLMPDRNQIFEEVLLCAPFEELISPDSKRPKYVGTIGRVSNRIAKGKFQLAEQEYTLAINNGSNHLHGGLKGFDKKVWSYSLINEEERVGVVFSLASPDMEEGYPGTVQVTAEYCLTATDEITMRFTATTDRSTPISLTNHAFWNLSGAFRSNIKSHLLELSCDGFLPIDSGLIPLGNIASVTGTPFDFTSPQLLGSAIDQIVHNGVPGIDHSFVSTAATIASLHHMATLSDPLSGRQLIIRSNQPAIQVYTGNFLPSSVAEEEGESRDPFRQHHGVCLECQGYPNAVNEPTFPSIILHPGEEYLHESIYSLRTGSP
jgi:aldose 1-epimerase